MLLSTFDLGVHQFPPGDKQKITKKRKHTVSWFTFVRLWSLPPDYKILPFFHFTAYHKNQQQTCKEPTKESLLIYPVSTTYKTGPVAVTP